jgi:hypothetical protein
MAIKRCCDWGQVENCERYDKVFVTMDRLAAVYAYYRKVKYIFIRDMRDIARYNKGLDKDWAQFTFVISKGYKE